MKKIYIALAAIVLIIIGIIYYFNFGGTSSTYSNSLLKYEVTIPSGWHVSETMSKKMDESLFVSQLASTIGCDISKMADQGGDASTLTQKLQDCMKNSPDLAKIELQNENFLKDWKIDNAQSVYITKFTSDEEKNFTLTDLSMPSDRLQAGSFIVIRPFDSVLSFTEATSSTKNGLIRSFYSLGDNTKTYLSDWRNTKIPQSGLTLSVPIMSEAQTLWTGGGLIKSLSVITTATKGSQSEKDFYYLIGSLKINK